MQNFGYLPLESVISKDGHDAWDDLTSDASLSAILNPLVEKVVVIEQLSDDEISTGLYLLLEIPNIVLTVLGREMNLWVASDSDAEEVTVLLLDEFHQVHCIVEPILNWDPVSSTSGRVASQGK